MRIIFLFIDLAKCAPQVNLLREKIYIFFKMSQSRIGLQMKQRSDSDFPNLSRDLSRFYYLGSGHSESVDHHRRGVLQQKVADPPELHTYADGELLQSSSQNHYGSTQNVL